MGRPNSMAPPHKKRKTDRVEELNFDPEARQDYLSGYRKRRLVRISEAKSIAKRKEREEKIEARQEIRQQRRDDLKKHLEEVDAILKAQNPDAIEDDAKDGEDGDTSEWQGFEELPTVDGTDEYVDEEKYTTVTIKEMGEGEEWDASEDENGVKKVPAEATKPGENADGTKKKRVWTKEKPTKSTKPKTKKKKFTYESKFERKKTQAKQKAKKASFAEKRKAK